MRVGVYIAVCGTARDGRRVWAVRGAHRRLHVHALPTAAIRADARVAPRDVRTQSAISLLARVPCADKFKIEIAA